MANQSAANLFRWPMSFQLFYDELAQPCSAVLETMGLTVSNKVRILLTRTANEGALPVGLISGGEAHDPWFRSKVLEALRDTRPDVPDQELTAHFEKSGRQLALKQRRSSREAHLVRI